VWGGGVRGRSRDATLTLVLLALEERRRRRRVEEPFVSFFISFIASLLFCLLLLHCGSFSFLFSILFVNCLFRTIPPASSADDEGPVRYVCVSSIVRRDL